MSKSIPAILGLGAAACVLLSLMMRHLVEQEAEQVRSPYAPAVEQRLGSRLRGPVRIRRVDAEGGEVLVVRARVLGGAGKRALAETIGMDVWLGAMRAGDAPAALRVELEDDDGGALFECAVPPPGR